MPASRGYSTRHESFISRARSPFTVDRDCHWNIYSFSVHISNWHPLRALRTSRQSDRTPCALNDYTQIDKHIHSSHTMSSSSISIMRFLPFSLVCVSVAAFGRFACFQRFLLLCFKLITYMSPLPPQRRRRRRHANRTRPLIEMVRTPYRWPGTRTAQFCSFFIYLKFKFDSRLMLWSWSFFVLEFLLTPFARWLLGARSALHSMWINTSEFSAPCLRI